MKPKKIVRWTFPMNGESIESILAIDFFTSKRSAFNDLKRTQDWNGLGYAGPLLKITMVITEEK